MSTSLTVVKNALANLARGTAAAVVGLFLPAILTRHMSQIDYSVWVLVLQIAAYSAYLDFGLQTAIGRFVAFANEKQDSALRDGIFSTAFVGLSLACLVGILLLIAIAAGVSLIFPQIPPQALPTMRWSLLILGVSTALGLPSSAWNGVLTGLQRNEISAVVLGGAKILSALAVVGVAIRGYSIIAMTAVLAAFNVLSYAVLFGVTRKIAPELTFQASLVRWSRGKELGQYCFSLTVWSFAMMLVTGLDLLLVGHFQVGALASYAVAASLVVFISGAQTAIFGALIAHAAVRQAQDDPHRLGRMVVTSTRIGILILVLTALPLLICGKPVLNLWVGHTYADQAYPFLVVLLAANIIRSMGAPYSAILVGTGQQTLVITGPIAEGLTNLIASIFLGIKFGALGVAYGTVIGGIVGMLAHVFYNMPRTSPVIRVRKRDYVVQGIGLPLLTSIPLVLVFVLRGYGPAAGPIALTAAFSASLALGVLLLFNTPVGLRRPQVRDAKGRAV